jgi:heat shock protein HtpX
MLFTIFLLGLLYVAFVGVLFAVGAQAIVILVAVGGLALAQLFLADKIGLAAMGAKEVGPDQAPGLHAMIERLCIQADLPKPKIAVADMAMPNAFAMGRSPKSSTVCTTTGLMNMLEPHELEAVMAHELSHVKNRDVMIMTIASFFAIVASIITQFGFFFGGGYGHGGDDDSPGFAIVIIAAFVVYILSFFLMLALSRYREFTADKGASLITGRPSALASALLKISGSMERVPEQDLRRAQTLNAFFIVPASAKRAVSSVFQSHPSTEKRIERLQRYEEELQRGLAA